MAKATRNKEKIESLKGQILEIAEKELKEREYIFTKDCLKKDEYNKLRAYMELCVMDSSSKLLDSVVEAEYDPVYGSRYKTVKKIDNLITEICQELL